MKARRLGLFALVCLLLVLVAACSAPPQAAPAAPPPAPATVAPPTPLPPTAVVPTATPQPTPNAQATMEVETVQFTSQALAANLLGDSPTRSIAVALPPGYATSSKRYPVFYMLGGYGDIGTRIVPFFKPAFETARRAGKVQDMIIVFLDGTNTLGGAFYIDSPTTGGWDTYVSKELVDYIDKHYRTLATRDSRGITGCSMGGGGAVHLGLGHPDVFGVVASIAGGYSWGDPGWKDLAAGLTEAPKDITRFGAYPFWTKVAIALAAAAAPNSNNPPYYMDVPWTFSGGDVQPVAAVIDRITQSDPIHDTQRHAKQAQRPNAFLLYHNTKDPMAPIEEVRGYSKLLTDLGIEHDLVEVDKSGHCEAIDNGQIIKFMSDHLAPAQ